MFIFLMLEILVSFDLFREFKMTEVAEMKWNKYVYLCLIVLFLGFFQGR